MTGVGQVTPDFHASEETGVRGLEDILRQQCLRAVNPESRSEDTTRIILFKSV